MLRIINIVKYHNLLNVNIGNVGSVNLLIGRNNTGKTNLLEAIYFYTAQENQQTDALIVDETAEEILTDELIIPANIKFIKSGTSLQSLLNENSFDSFSDEIQVRALKCLQLLDDRIAEIDFLADNLQNPLATYKNGKIVSLLRMGNGVHRILTILLALSTSKGGVVLIDEIEKGLHYSVQEMMWDLIFDISKMLDVQVFATTHSLDAIRAFGLATNKSADKDGLLIKLERVDGVIEPLCFDAEEQQMITEGAIEVRR